MPSSAKLLCVDPERVDEVWPHVERFIAAATERCGDWRPESIKSELENGALLWVLGGQGIEATCVTRLSVTKHGLVCDVLACGGEAECWQDHLTGIEKYAADEGCTRVRIEGREGWKRALSGYRPAWIVLEKEI